MTKKITKQMRFSKMFDEIDDIRKIIAEGRDEVQGDIESLSLKIRKIEGDIELKREREEELNDALRKLDHLQTLKDRLKIMLDKEQENVDPEAGNKKEKKKK